MNPIKLALVLSLGPLVASCVTVQSGAKPSSSTYQFVSFEIDVPAGGNWGISETDYENEKITFSTASYAFMASKVTTMTSLAVAKVPVPPNMVMRSEEEVFSTFCASGEKAFAKETASHGVELKAVRKGAVEVDGKKLRTVSFEGVVGNWFVGGQGGETHVWAWFPPDYESRQVFYAFILSTQTEKGIYQESANLKPLQSFVAGFRYHGGTGP
jgi:hypothetical protein